ncbi:hypothetical protein T190_25345 [Sinorhizobium meliloti CCBAU 01290]|nr:hypothetical protein T190_25345 [Sinorhizobium meliloti CCBAU 01290]
MARARHAPAGRDAAGERVIETVDELHVVRAEIEGCGAVRFVPGTKADRAVLVPDFAIGEGDVEAVRLADEAVDKGETGWS